MEAEEIISKIKEKLPEEYNNVENIENIMYQIFARIYYLKCFEQIKYKNIKDFLGELTRYKIENVNLLDEDEELILKLFHNEEDVFDDEKLTRLANLFLEKFLTIAMNLTPVEAMKQFSQDNERLHLELEKKILLSDNDSVFDSSRSSVSPGIASKLDRADPSISELAAAKYAALLVKAKEFKINLDDLTKDHEDDVSFNPIAAFFQDQNVPEECKKSLERWLNELEKDSKENTILQRKINTLLHIPGWGNCIDPREIELKQIAKSEENIEQEMLRVQEHFTRLGMVDNVEIYQIFLEHYELELQDRYDFYQKAENKDKYFSQERDGQGKDRKFLPLCFDGPPGTGKTSILKDIADALHFKMQFYALSDRQDNTIATGKDTNWKGGGEGGLAINRGLFVFDEMDKASSETLNALTQVLATTTTNKIKDAFLDVELPVLGIFIGTSNNYDALPSHIKSRMRSVKVPGYTLAEKENIVNTWLERYMTSDAMRGINVEIDPDLVKFLVENYSHEAGVREIIAILHVIKNGTELALMHKIQNNELQPGSSYKLTKDDLEKFLTAKKYKKLTTTQKKLLELQSKYDEIFKEILKLQQQDKADRLNDPAYIKRLQELNQIGGKLLSLYEKVIKPSTALKEKTDNSEITESYQRDIKDKIPKLNLEVLWYRKQQLKYELEKLQAAEPRDLNRIEKITKSLLAVQTLYHQQELDLARHITVDRIQKINTKTQLLEDRKFLLTLADKVTPLDETEVKKLVELQEKLPQYIKKYYDEYHANLEFDDAKAEKIQKKIVNLKEDLDFITKLLKKNLTKTTQDSSTQVDPLQVDPVVGGINDDTPDIPASSLTGSDRSTATSNLEDRGEHSKESRKSHPRRRATGNNDTTPKPTAIRSIATGNNDTTSKPTAIRSIATGNNDTTLKPTAIRSIATGNNDTTPKPTAIRSIATGNNDTTPKPTVDRAERSSSILRRNTTPSSPVTNHERGKFGAVGSSSNLYHPLNGEKDPTSGDDPEGQGERRRKGEGQRKGQGQGRIKGQGERQRKGEGQGEGQRQGQLGTGSVLDSRRNSDASSTATSSRTGSVSSQLTPLSSDLTKPELAGKKKPQTPLAVSTDEAADNNDSRRVKNDDSRQVRVVGSRSSSRSIGIEIGPYTPESTVQTKPHQISLDLTKTKLAGQKPQAPSKLSADQKLQTPSVPHNPEPHSNGHNGFPHRANALDAGANPVVFSPSFPSPYPQAHPINFSGNQENSNSWAAYLEHLNYKKIKLEKKTPQTNPNPQWMHEKLHKFKQKEADPGGLEQHLARKTTEDRRKNLYIERNLYSDWESTQTNYNSYQVKNSDNRSYVIEYKPEDQKLLMHSTLEMLNDEMLIQMVEAQRRAGNTVITVSGIFDPSKDPQHNQKGIDCCKKLDEATRAIGLKLEFDQQTKEYLNRLRTSGPMSMRSSS